MMEAMMSWKKFIQYSLPILCLTAKWGRTGIDRKDNLQVSMPEHDCPPPQKTAINLF